MSSIKQETSSNDKLHTLNLLKENNISISERFNRNINSVKNKATDFWDGFHIKHYDYGDVYTGNFLNG